MFDQRLRSANGKNLQEVALPPHLLQFLGFDGNFIERYQGKFLNYVAADMDLKSHTSE